MEVYKKPRKSIVEVVDDAGKSVLRYRGHDRKLRYVASSDSPEGGGGGAEAPLVEVTHAELKAMRDGGKLTAGALYRITDYNCTTTQENTQSAGHQFDIVLLALSANKLAEEGWAMMHENDTYFANSNLSAWKVWYCLDNDKSRFAWADDGEAINILYEGEDYQMIRNTSDDVPGLYAWFNEDFGTLYTNNETPQIGDNLYWQDGTLAEEEELTKGIYFNGRGVIYRLIDEFNNDIKYDFKNIQFKRKLTDGQYNANGTETWCYTLNIWYNDMCQDASIIGNTLPNDEGIINGVYDNKFGYATAYDLSLEGVSTFAFALGDNVVLSFDDAGYVGIKSNAIGNGFISNTIGNGFISNTIGNGFISNTIGNHFGVNIIGNHFEFNTIGNAFSINTIESDFTANVIGNYFNGNTIRGNFTANTIGNDFNGKTINNDTTYKNYGNNGVELATKS